MEEKEMLYRITVYQIRGNKRNRVYEKELQARDGINAMEQANVRFQPGRVVEIRQIENPDGFAHQERPRVKRVARDGA
jgi:hypothetical protein